MCECDAAQYLCEECGNLAFCQGCTTKVHTVRSMRGHAVRSLDAASAGGGSGGGGSAPPRQQHYASRFMRSEGGDRGHSGTPPDHVGNVWRDAEAAEAAYRQKRARQHPRQPSGEREAQSCLVTEVTHATARHRRTVKALRRDSEELSAAQRARHAADRQAVSAAFETLRAALDAEERTLLAEADRRHEAREAEAEELARGVKELERYLDRCENTLLADARFEELQHVQTGLAEAERTEVRVQEGVGRLAVCTKSSAPTLHVDPKPVLASIKLLKQQPASPQRGAAAAAGNGSAPAGPARTPGARPGGAGAGGSPSPATAGHSPAQFGRSVSGLSLSLFASPAAVASPQDTRTRSPKPVSRLHSPAYLRVGRKLRS
eukprot:Rhum_TRINITY_DN14338_c2_g2::Rhum_TRINITY_DN14338_c2_g2_i1::g.81606::m.81606